MALLKSLAIRFSLLFLVIKANLSIVVKDKDATRFGAKLLVRGQKKLDEFTICGRYYVDVVENEHFNYDDMHYILASSIGADFLFRLVLRNGKLIFDLAQNELKSKVIYLENGGDANFWMKSKWNSLCLAMKELSKEVTITKVTKKYNGFPIKPFNIKFHLARMEFQ